MLNNIINMIYVIKEFLFKKGFKYEISKSAFSKNIIHIFYLDDNKWKCYLSIKNAYTLFTHIRLEFFKSDEDYINNEKYYYEILTHYNVGDYIELSEEYYHIVDIFIEELDFLLNRELIHHFRKIKIKKLLNDDI